MNPGTPGGATMMSRPMSALAGSAHASTGRRCISATQAAKAAASGRHSSQAAASSASQASARGGGSVA